MLLRAIVSQSVMDDLLKDLSGSEIRHVQLSDNVNLDGKVTLVGADCTADKILRVAQTVQAGISGSDLIPTLDRLVVSSHSELGEFQTDNHVASLCYWTNVGEKF